MRKEPEVAFKYRKDTNEERFLFKLNNILAPYQEKEYQELKETSPTLHIIGVPRSGTTPLLQLLAFHLTIGYINNLIAAFWRAPVYGIRLSKKLIPPYMQSSFKSDFGRTTGIHEPHEFGYFWSSELGYKEPLQQNEDFEDTINWNRLRLVITNMTHAFGSPIVFKSFYLGWHIAKMQEILPKTCFIRIRRDPIQNAASLIKMRKEFLGSVEKWASLKPKEYRWLKDEPYWRQVAGQVYYLEKSMSRQIELVKGHNIFDVRYEDFCKHPKDLLLKVKKLFENNGNNVEIISEPPKSFDIKLADSELEEKERSLIKSAIHEFYDGTFD